LQASFKVIDLDQNAELSFQEMCDAMKILGRDDLIDSIQ